MSALQKAYDDWAAAPSKEKFLALLRASKERQEMAIKAYGGAPDTAMRLQANILTAHALQTYNPEKGTNVDTHLMNQLKPLYRFAANRELLRVPEGVRQLQHRAFAAEKELEEELGRAPTSAELADYTGVPLNRLENIRTKYHLATPESVLVGEEGEPIQPVVTTNPRVKTWENYVYASLPTTDQHIMEMSLGYNGKPKLGTGAIARKLGLSDSAVSQRIGRIGDRLLEGTEFYEQPD